MVRDQEPRWAAQVDRLHLVAEQAGAAAEKRMLRLLFITVDMQAAHRATLQAVRQERLAGH